MKRFYFTPAQDRQLLDMWQETAASLVQISFDSPSDDELNIRRVAYLQGQLALLRTLREDEFPDPVTPQQESSS